MRHCRRFLAGIPHWKAGHPCVTHPSATPSSRKTRTCDLHVLGTPPAFILSQDQTRHPKVDHHSGLGGRSGEVLWQRCDPGQAAVHCVVHTWLFADVRLPPAADLTGEASRRGSQKLTGTACCGTRGDAHGGACFALTKHQLLFCFPLFSC